MKTDFELLDAWGTGDAGAGSELFHRHFAALYGFFRSKVTEGADDLVQQTFMACVESRDRFARRSSFRTYLYGTARNVLRHGLRTRARHGREVDLEVATLCDLQPSPSRVLALKGERRLLLEALRRIPVDYQIALELYHWEGLTGPELAEVLELAEPGVRSRLRRAHEALRRTLAELADSPEQLESTLAGLSDWAHDLRAHLRSS